MSNSSSAPGDVLGQRDGREHDRYGAPQPGPRHEHLLAQRHPVRHTSRRSPRAAGPRRSAADRPATAMPRRSRAMIRSGRQQQPEHHEQPDLRQPGDALGEGPGRGAVRQLAVAEHQRGRVDGGEPGGVQGRRTGVGEDRQASAPRSGTGPTTAARPGASPRRRRSRPRARRPRRRPARRPRCRRSRARRGPAPRRCSTSDTSRTVGASLSPDSASSAPVRRSGSGTRRSTENTAAASVGDVTAPSSTASCQSRPNR